MKWSRGRYIKNSPLGDFALWNELKRRGHEVMPHGYRHENLQKLAFAEGQELINRCLGVFSEKLEGFDPKQAIFNFPYNASTPELETWLLSEVRAFRTGGGAINPRLHRGQAKLTCTSFGPGNCEAAIDRELEKLLARESGWLIYCSLRHVGTDLHSLAPSAGVVGPNGLDIADAHIAQCAEAWLFHLVLERSRPIT